MTDTLCDRYNATCAAIGYPYRAEDRIGVGYSIQTAPLHTNGVRFVDARELAEMAELQERRKVWMDEKAAEEADRRARMDDAARTLAEGRSGGAVGRALGVSPRTVRRWRDGQ